MGILDDAIREHLELKRQHGAGDDDLERLEKEAFGPLTRPGDPEFPDPDAAAAEPSEPAVAQGDGGDSGRSADWFSDEEETRVLTREPEPAPAADVDPHETVAHPAPEPTAAELPEAAEPTAEAAPPPPAEPPEAPERAIFDAEEIDFGDLDVDLDAQEEEAPRKLAGSHAASAAPPLEDLDDDLELDLPGDPGAPAQDPAHRQADLIEDDEDAPPLPIPPAGGEGEGKPGEDLLEETPDFLQDAPDGERLWFEQGAPKDFDFDEDD